MSVCTYWWLMIVKDECMHLLVINDCKGWVYALIGN